MKNILLVLFSVIVFSPFSKAQVLCTPDSIYADSLPGVYTIDIPPLVQGQPYNATVTVKCAEAMYFDFQNIPVFLIVRGMKILDVVNEPAGFDITVNYNDPNGYWYNYGSDPNYNGAIACFTISADANAVDAAMANNGGSGVLTFDIYYDVWGKGNPIPATYTWLSTLGTPPYGAALRLPITLGGNVDYTQFDTTSCIYNLYYNGQPSGYAGLASTAGTFQVDVNATTDTCDWVVFTSQNSFWFTVSPTSGNGDGTLTITYEENTTGEERYGSVFVNNISYQLTQITGDCSVAMSIDTSFVGPLEGTVYITVDAADSCYWSIINRSQFCDWVDVNPLSGTGPGTIEISYNANNAGQARNCEININGTTITLNQQAVGLDENIAGKLTLYPNPAADLVNINLPTSANKITLNIYDTAGQLVGIQQLQGGGLQQISTAGLVNGFYLFVVQNADSVIGRSMVAVNR
jgi:hypothetical protein